MRIRLVDWLGWILIKQSLVGMAFHRDYLEPWAESPIVNTMGMPNTCLNDGRPPRPYQVVDRIIAIILADTSRDQADRIVHCWRKRIATTLALSSSDRGDKGE